MMLRCVRTELVPGEVICLFCAASVFPKFPLYFLISYWRMPPGLRCQCSFSVLKFWILCQGYVLSVQTIKTNPHIITYNWYRMQTRSQSLFICVISKIIIINCFPSNTNHDLPLSTVSPPQQTASRASNWNTRAPTPVEFLSTEAMPSFSSGEEECRM